MRFKGLVSCTAALLVAAAVPVFPQSLADVAKKEEERRRKIPEPAKVYTNKDLVPVPTSSTPPPAAVPGEPAAPAPAATAPGEAPRDDAEKDKDKDKEKDPKKTQAYWAGKMKSLTDEVSRNETFAEGLQSRINALQTDFVNRDDPAQRAVIEQNRRKAATELDRLKKTIADGKKAITDLEEDARRAGIPPGWLR
jgi:hypothetical protein